MSIKCLMYDYSHIPTPNKGHGKVYGCINLDIESKLEIYDYASNNLNPTHEYDIIWIYGLDLGFNPSENYIKNSKFIDYLNEYVNNFDKLIFDLQGEGAHNVGFLNRCDNFRNSLNYTNYTAKILWNINQKIYHKDYDIFYKPAYELVYWYYAKNIIKEEFSDLVYRNYIFSFLNGKIGDRPHRYTMLKKIDGLNGGLISCLDSSTDVKYRKLFETDSLINKFASGGEIVKQSYINLVSETDDGSETNGIFITEKSLKPFIYSQIPIILGKSGIVNHLRSYGFDMFDDIIDHAYDSVDNIDEKTDLIYVELEKISKLKLPEMYSTLIDRFKHNYDLFYKLVDDNRDIKSEIANWILN